MFEKRVAIITAMCGGKGIELLYLRAQKVFSTLLSLYDEFGKFVEFLALNNTKFISGTTIKFDEARSKAV